jgi:hypothetical protein
MRRTFTLIFAFTMIAAHAADDPCAPKETLADWLTCRLSNRITENIKQAATEKQSDSPSAASSSTSLLDRTSGPDLVGAAIRLLGTGGQTTGSQSGDVTVSASAYSLYAAATGNNPLSPSFYDTGVTARRLSVTLGHETVQDQKDLMAGPNKIAGAKFLILNYRDVSTAKNKAEIAPLVQRLGDTARDFDQLVRAVTDFIENHAAKRMGISVATPQEKLDFETDYLQAPELQKTLALLTSEELSTLEQIVFNSAASSSYAALAAKVKSTVDRIRHKPQLSIAYTAKISENKDGPVLHRSELVFDMGVNAWSNLTVNAGFDYFNSPKVGADIRTGRVAAEGQFELNHTQALARGIRPYVVAFSAESKWNNTIDPIYKVQGRIEIPLTKGITLPISVTHANRTELIKEADTKGQFGFTIDVSKLAGLFAATK